MFGITLARLLADDYQVDIYERRAHIGGNCYDYRDRDTGILIHKYGPHILHVNDPEILAWISQFTTFNNYKHQVKANHMGVMYDFPINLATINRYFNSQLKPCDLSSMLINTDNTSDANLEQRLLRMIGKELYEAFFKYYTTKQWGKPPSELPAGLISRIPIHANYSTSYYKKIFNGMPADGFTTMFKKMLDHANIRLHLNSEFKLNDISHENITVYTGSIDHFFNYKLGCLPYRTLNFSRQILPLVDFQGVSVVNYPDADVPWTRICEPKHFYPENRHIFDSKPTVIIYEIPGYDPMGEPYYPIPEEKNTTLYQKYLKMAESIPNLHFAGRMGAYRYYDMENCIAEAFKLARQIRLRYPSEQGNRLNA